MNPATSVYLDFVRFMAATMVFLTHAAYPRLQGEWIGAWRGFGHDSVVVFFVLSGYVIGYVSANKHTHVSNYTVSRFARLWSVVLPALLVGAAVNAIGSSIDPELYAGNWCQTEAPAYGFVANLFFFSELWLSSVPVACNVPFWSVSYEAWYYVFFAAWFYTRGAWSWVATIAAAFIMGPKLILLLPIWWFGYWAYRRNTLGPLHPVVCYGLFFGSMVAYYCMREFDVAHVGARFVREMFGAQWVLQHLSWSARFPGDLLLGLLVAANFIGFFGISERLGSAILHIATPVRWLAGFTFSIYLFHYPLLHFYGALTHDSLLTIALAVASILLLGQLTEKKKGPYVAALKRAGDGFGTWIRRVGN